MTEIAKFFTNQQSMLTQHGSELSEEVVTWLQSCPNNSVVGKFLQKLSQMDEKMRCSECGEDYVRKELRFDVASPCGDPDKLICKGCWEMYNEGLWGDPDYRPPVWPEQYDANSGLQNASGEIVDLKTRSVIGRVEKYNPNGHFGKVTLSGYEEDAEYGSLEPNWTVLYDE